MEARWGIRYTYAGMWEVMTRLRLGLKVPRPQAEKASPLAQVRWKKGAVRSALIGAGLTQAQQVWHVDEMRFGLWGQTRRRWGLRGIKIVQPLQVTFAWRYLVLAVNCRQGQLQ